MNIEIDEESNLSNICNSNKIITVEDRMLNAGHTTLIDLSSSNYKEVELNVCKKSETFDETTTFNQISTNFQNSQISYLTTSLVDHWSTISQNNLPGWLKDNHFILEYHRPELRSSAGCLLSIFRLHTETLNIWTHLLGCIMYLTTGICYAFDKQILTISDKAVFLFFFISAFLCMSGSWIFHTFQCHSKDICLFCNKLDYCGIAILTVGSYVPWIYYSFYCQIAIKIFYILLSIILSILVAIISSFDRFASPPYRNLRAIIFVSLGLSAVIPSIHGIIIYGFWICVERMSLDTTVLMACFYIIGASIYAARIPERLYPGTFDLIFQSHQILHIFVILGSCVHHYGLVKLFNITVTKYDCLIGPQCYFV